MLGRIWSEIKITGKKWMEGNYKDHEIYLCECKMLNNDVFSKNS